MLPVDFQTIQENTARYNPYTGQPFSVPDRIGTWSEDELNERYSTAGVLVFSPDGSVVLGGHNVRTSKYGDILLWGPFAGSREPQDGSPWETAKREFLEETGHELNTKPSGMTIITRTEMDPETYYSTWSYNAGVVFLVVLDQEIDWEDVKTKEIQEVRSFSRDRVLYDLIQFGDLWLWTGGWTHALLDCYLYAYSQSWPASDDLPNVKNIIKYMCRILNFKSGWSGRDYRRGGRPYSHPFSPSNQAKRQRRKQRDCISL